MTKKELSNVPFLCFLFSALVLSNCQSSLVEQDEIALEAIRKSFELDNLWTGNNPCSYSWPGVVCSILKVPVNALDGSTRDTFISNLKLSKLSLSGILPIEIGNFISLFTLELDGNNFTGPIPSSVANNIYLNKLDLSGNDFQGTLPLTFGNLTELTYLDASNNSLTGTIPDELQNMKKLQALVLDNNKFTGEIPSFIGELPELTVLTLQNNGLDGVVPESVLKFQSTLYGNPDLCILDSNGKCNLIQSPSETSTSDSVSSSADKCEQGLTVICQCGDRKQGSQTCTNAGWTPCNCHSQRHYELDEGNGRSSLISTLFIALGGAMTALLIVIFIYGVCRYKNPEANGLFKKGKVHEYSDDVEKNAKGSYNPPKLREVNGNDNMQMQSKDDLPVARPHNSMSLARTFGITEHPVASMAEGVYAESSTGKRIALHEYEDHDAHYDDDNALKPMGLEQIRLATENFAYENILRNDDECRVYMGELLGGTIVIIKELEFMTHHHQDARIFAKRVEELESLDHPHLVNVLSYCVEEDNRLLVLEYIPNDSLYHHLHGGDLDEVLEWEMRMQTALGVAEGLEYLHTSSLQIVHQELRSTNVLFDEDFKVKLSDYGLSRLSYDGTAPVSYGRLASANMAVASGLVAPELAWSQNLTFETDVYSFGVLLLEIITGRKPLDPELPPNEQALVRWARPRLTERSRVDGLVDPNLAGMISSPALYQVALLAWQCIQLDSSTRPNMSQVVQILRNVQNLPLDMPVAFEPAEERRLHEFLQGDMPDIPTATVQWAPVTPSSSRDGSVEKVRMKESKSTANLQVVIPARSFGSGSKSLTTTPKVSRRGVSTPSSPTHSIG